MNITLSPMRSDERLTLARSGDIMTINGEAFDFSALPDGAVLPREAIACDWIADDVRRERGTLAITLIFPHGQNAPPEALSPEVISNPPDGEIPLPIANIEIVEE